MLQKCHPPGRGRHLAVMLTCHTPLRQRPGQHAAGRPALDKGDDLNEMTMSDGRPLAEVLMDKGRLSAERAQTLVQEYHRFLRLAANGPGPVVLSPVLDQVWHLHLTDTRAYAAFCEGAFGRFLHHSPGRAPQADDPAYARTLEAYAQAFGHPPDGRVWPSPATLRTLRWIGAPIMLGAGLVAFGLMGLGGWLVAVGAALFAGGLIWAVTRSPWMIGNRSSSGCGGGSGCGGD